MKEFDEIDNCLSFDFNYIPYRPGMKLNIKDKEYVYKNSLLLTDEKPIYSNVSGVALGIAKLNGKKYIVIENDFKDKLLKHKGAKKNINKYTKDEFISLMKEFPIISDFDENSKVLIISGISEYYEESTYRVLINNYVSQILETIDAIIEIMNIRKCFFAIDSKKTESIDLLVSNLGTYPKIDLKIFNNDLSLGNKEILINKLTNYKNKNYKILFLNIRDVLDIYNILKFKRSVTETYINLKGNLINIDKVIRIKIGTNLADILKEYNIENKEFILNGLLNGKIIKDRNYIIDRSIRSIFVNTINTYQELPCINCGACLQCCPVHINPKYMHFNTNKKSQEYEKKCVKCGLCSYVCPSKIELVKGDKDD